MDFFQLAEPISILNYFGSIEHQNQLTISFDFPDLCKKLNNGLQEGLYIIGAIPGLGKTIFASQLAEQIAKNYNVFFFSLEMNKYAILAKGLSRLTYEQYRNDISSQGNYMAKTTMDFLNFNTYNNFSNLHKDVIEKTKILYAQKYNKLHIFDTNSSNDDICDIQILLKYCEEGLQKIDQKTVIFIDYLQLLKNKYIYEPKQIMDECIISLKKISKKYQIPIILISSLPRSAYFEPISISSFKESGSIEYSADVLLGMQYKGFDIEKNDNSYKRQNKISEIYKNINLKKDQRLPIPFELVCLKNKNGITFTHEMNIIHAYNYIFE